MLLVDAHCHLDHVLFKDDLDQVIERAKSAGVKAIITSGINPESNRKALSLANKYNIIKVSLGMYPVDALAKEIEVGEYPMQPNVFDVDEELKFIEQNKDKCVAIGECGLDYHWIKGKNKEQKELFSKIISLVEKLKKPIIVHTREAEADAVEMLESSKITKIILHCFSGKKALVKRAYEHGWHFTIPTNIVRSHHFQGIVKLVNISQLLTETDAPYLSPFKEKKNEPAFVIETIKKIAEIKKMDTEEVANNIYMNYQRLF
jgi:TatD DNase family protein